MFEAESAERAHSQGLFRGRGDGMGDKMASAVQASDRELESEAMRQLHRRLWGFFLYEQDRQAENRSEMGLDADFYDNDQWDDGDKKILQDRNQAPLVFNVIATTINWLIGTERRGRTDFKVLPRRKDGGRAAELKTQLLKYISDVSNSEFAKSRAFQDAIKVGVGWLESGAQDTVDGEPVFDRAESWRNVLWDSHAQELDLSDARFIARHKWLDTDIAMGIRKSRGAVVKRASSVDRDGVYELGDEHMDSSEDLYDLIGSSSKGEHMELYAGVHRPRVRVVEMWFTMPVETSRIRGGDFNGEVYDQYSPGHIEAMQSGEAELVKSSYMRMHVALMTAEGFIHLSESPYRHNRFPFTPVWCYRRDRDGMPYGVIRGLRDIQQDVNKRASKALHILSTNKVIMDKGAVDDLDEFEEEVARPDAIIVKNKGYDLVLNADREIAAGHLDLMSRSIAMIQQASGVTDESLGRTTNATSGKAIIARQDQGALATAALFDNYRFACKLHGEKMLSLIEQFVSSEKSFRITNSRGVATYVQINDGLPENDIVRTKADFIISEDQWRASWREAQVQALLQSLGMAQLPPEAYLAMLDLIVDMMDVPFKDEIVARIRNFTGAKDPDADPDAPPTPEEMAKMEAEAAAQQMQQRMAEAEVTKMEAEAAEAMAKASKIGAEIKNIAASMVGSNVASQRAALEAALALISVPQAADAADAILTSSGFKGGDMPDLGPAPAPAPAMQPPMGQTAPPQQVQ